MRIKKPPFQASTLENIKNNILDFSFSDVPIVKFSILDFSIFQMKRHKQNIFLFLLIALIFNWQGADAKSNNEDHIPLANKGILDLRDWDFNKQGSIALDGEWAFYWETLLMPKDFPTQFKPTYQQFSQLWNNTEKTNYASFGYATYSLKIVIDSSNKVLALEIPALYSSYELWLNGKLFAVNGEVGTNKNTSKPYWLPLTASFIGNSNNIHIIVQISNFQHNKGGASQLIKLGTAKQLFRDREMNLGIDLLLTGALIMGGLFLLGLFLFGRQNKAVLYFALFCLVYSYRIIGTEPYYLHNIFPELSWQITTRLEYLTLFLSTFLFMYFIQILYPKETSKLMANLLKVTTLILVLLSLFTPASWFTKSIEPFLIILLIYIIYATVIIIRAAKHKREGAQYAVLSFAVLFVIINLQVLNYLNYLPLYPYIYFVGYMLFFFFQSLILSYRFAHYFKRAKISAESGAKAKADFMATMSHEIRTPMNGVIGMTSLLQETNLTKEQSEYVDTIRISGDNLLTVINDILDFSKIEQGKMELEIYGFDLINCVEEVFTLLSPVAGKKNLELLFTKDIDVPRFIITDPNRLKQILINLLNNAIKFTIKGEVLLSISFIRKTSDSLELQFSVKDTGIGIPKKKIESLFQSFTQLDSSIARRFEGTGLGLAISKQLVNLMGGKIWAESVEHQGSTFSFTIVAKEDLSLGENTILPDRKLLKDKNALILDDNITNLKILSTQLKRWGMKVAVASLPEQAIDFVKEKQFDFAIVDMQMPGTNGITVTRKFLNLKYGKKLPVILLSSIKVNFKDDERKLFSSYILKPAREFKLWKGILKAIGEAENKNIETKENKTIQPSFKEAKVLVAEDNLINQKVTNSLLNKLGIKPDIVENGLQAFEACKTKDYHLILMDIQMPKMDGHEATKQILAHFKAINKKPPIILAMTANVLGDSQAQCLNSGMLGFISKPVSPKELEKSLSKWLTEYQTS